MYIRGDASLLGLGRHDLCKGTSVNASLINAMWQLTLNIRHALLQDLLENLGVLELLLDLGNH